MEDWRSSRLITWIPWVAGSASLLFLVIMLTVDMQGNIILFSNGPDMLAPAPGIVACGCMGAAILMSALRVYLCGKRRWMWVCILSFLILLTIAVLFPAL